MAPVFLLTLTLLIAPWPSSAKIMRNNALLGKMMSDYRDKTHPSSTEPRQTQGRPGKVLSLMQDVLCRNFPAIPCNLITKDEKLRELIQESIQEIQYKRQTIAPTESTVRGDEYPIVNSEELSNFLQVRNTGYFDDKETIPQKEHKHKKAGQKVWSKSRCKTHSHHEFDQETVYGKKKIRKFYPHKTKYKDKQHDRHHTRRTEYVAGHNQQENTVTSRPETKNKVLHTAPTYREDLGEAPVWRIDYTKHGEPRFNLMGLSERDVALKTGNDVLIDKSGLDGMPRNDVLHSDVYIKNNYPKKTLDEFGSDGF